MNDQEIKQWYTQRMQYAANLVDYMMLIGQNNRVLQSREVQISVTGLALGPNPNRVALAIAGTILNSASAGRASIQFKDDAGVVLFEHALFNKEADIAGVSLSPLIYSPVNWTILGLGPLIQRQVNVTISAGGPVGTVSLCEVTMNPKCCDYIGGMRGGDMEPHGQRPGV